MFKNFNEILSLIDPDSVLLTKLQRYETETIKKKVLKILEFSLKKIEDKNFINQKLQEKIDFLENLDENHENYCEICFTPIDKSEKIQAKEKQGHVKCLNFWLNRLCF